MSPWNNTNYFDNNKFNILPRRSNVWARILLKPYKIQNIKPVEQTIKLIKALKGAPVSIENKFRYRFSFDYFNVLLVRKSHKQPYIVKKKLIKFSAIKIET